MAGEGDTFMSSVAKKYCSHLIVNHACLHPALYLPVTTVLLLLLLTSTDVHGYTLAHGGDSHAGDFAGGGGAHIADRYSGEKSAENSHTWGRRTCRGSGWAGGGGYIQRRTSVFKGNLTNGGDAHTGDWVGGGGGT